MASLDRPDYCSESELYVFRPCSKMVHPSLPRARGRIALSSKAIDNFCLERRVHIEEKAKVKSKVSSILRTKSGKLKKKVRLRLPEEGDIIIFCSLEQ